MIGEKIRMKVKATLCLTFKIQNGGFLTTGENAKWPFKSTNNFGPGVARKPRKIKKKPK